MAKIIRCECGYIARGQSDTELVEDATRHARDVHQMDLTAAQVLAMAEPA